LVADDPAAPTAGGPARFAAAMGAILVLGFGVFISAGMVLFAPLGAWLVRRARDDGREIGPGARWVASTVTVGLVAAVVAGLTWLALPSGTLTQARRVSDSVAAVTPPPPPPAWIERVAPGSAARAKQQAAIETSRPAGLQTAITVWGGVMGVGLLIAVYGTLGWVGGLLMSFARRGRWPASPAPDVEPAP
jgi:hypothetical protein